MDISVERRSQVRIRAGDHPAERTIWVLSYNNTTNFGDRLLTHLIPMVLPPHACVRWIHHNPWDAPPEGRPDLLIVGGGNSLFGPLLTPDLLRLLDRAKHKIGIFGTQYRDGFPAERMTDVVGRLDTWFARYREDIELYGQGHPDARHLGDWLITLFPMAEPRNNRTLEIGPEVLKVEAMDHLIRQIQCYPRVFSTRLHPLVCALPSAREVKYVEQREAPGLGPSGKFGSMLRDVFGAAPPENEWWSVDRGAVLAYKLQVARNVEGLRRRFAELLA